MTLNVPLQIPADVIHEIITHLVHMTESEAQAQEWSESQPRGPLTGLLRVSKEFKV
jgi:hypothetical protein